MTITTENRRSGAHLGAVRTILHHGLDGLRERHARSQTRNATMAELSRLSDRSLGDIGIARGDIGRFATEATHGRR